MKQNNEYQSILNDKFPADGIVLYAKQSGITSFTSLWAIKHALNTSKVGHTGTLDNFADGLLVVLSNRMTKFVSHITDFDKTYEAIVKLGEETDTLDRDGNIIKTAAIPSEKEFMEAAKSFVGEIDQFPPVYSAIQIKGQRASDLIRQGKTVEVKSRRVEIYENIVVELKMPYVHLRIKCSKGTYIRSLARDIAYKCNSVAHLVSLRRTSVGPFLLKDAVGYNKLPQFCLSNIEKLMEKIASPSLIEEPEKEEIQNATKHFTPEIAKQCGFNVLILKHEFYEDFLSGRPVNINAFEPFNLEWKKELIVFAYENSARKKFDIPRLCGMININGKRAKYIFVIQDDKPLIKRVNHKKPKNKAAKIKKNVSECL
ncbi:MAG: tRNA pseudouridine(55) synthase TruB [Treponema sp.]|nr:tRNA pseudouridine(55) synthase TruB [Treponema sp.]